MPNDAGYFTTQDPNATTSEYNASEFVVAGLMNGRHYAEPVEVVEVTIPAGLSEAGRVSVKPLINMVDGEGNVLPHDKINNLVYFRLQGGKSAFVIDPKVGDKGMAIFIDRDMSSVKANKGAANPGSARRSSWSDGWYIGGLLNGVPNQYVRMSEDGIEIVSPTVIKLNAPSIQMDCDNLDITAGSGVTITSPANTINGPLRVTGAIISDTSVTAPNIEGSTDVTSGDISLRHHKTSLVQTGTGTSGPPVP